MVAWTDENANLQIGYFDGNPQHNYLNQVVPINIGGLQTSYFSPALEVDPTSGYLRIAWTGTDSNQTPNIARTYDGVSWGPKNTWSGQHSAGGPGFTYYCPSSGFCGPYLSWIGTDASSDMNVGYYNPSSGSFTKLITLGGQPCNSQQMYDASLVVQGGALYLPYVDSLGNVAITTTPNLSIWDCQDLSWFALYGASGSVDGGNHLWIAWISYPDLMVNLAPYN